MSGSSGRASALIVLLLGLFCAALLVHQRFIGGDGRAYEATISGDGEGYYAYLIAAFIQRDLDHPRIKENLFSSTGDDHVIKFTCGTALLQAPFFLAAHLIATLSPWPADGQSPPYPIAIGIGSLCYAVLGLRYLRRLLQSFNLGDGPVAFALCILLLGTGLLYYAVLAPSMSHVYSFSMVACALDAGRRAWLAPARSTLLRTTFLLALVVLIRPTNLLIVLALPVLTIGGTHAPIAWLRKVDPRTWLAAGTLFIALIGLQPLLWYLQCGHFFVRPYSTEGFLWDRPMLWSVLFGARKGLFFYWPLLLLAVPGAVMLFRRSKVAGGALVIALLSIIYVTGCWWNWYYGWSYGMRPLIDVLPLFSIPIGFLANKLWSSARWSLLLGCVPFMALQLFQTRQYTLGIIDPENMDREKYAIIFLKGGDRSRGIFGGANMVPPYAPRGLDTLVDTRRDGDPFRPHWSESASSDGTFVLDATHPISPGIVVDNLRTRAGASIYLEVSLMRKALDVGAARTGVVVCSLSDDRAERIHITWPMEEVPQQDDRLWRHWRYAFIAPPPLHGERFSMHIEQTGQGTLLLKDVQVRVSVPR